MSKKDFVNALARRAATDSAYTFDRVAILLEASVGSFLDKWSKI